jgi:UPF0042 nucleotide-binding protein
MRSKRLILVTGLSGAGKSQAIRCFEDLGFFCIDNLPPALIPTFAQLCQRSREPIDQVALVTDVRGGEFFNDLFSALEALQGTDFHCQILFLDAATTTLIQRFKETRRPHPLTGHYPTLLECIEAERERLRQIKERADVIIDTSEATPRELQAEIEAVFRQEMPPETLTVSLTSFGFKYGIPVDVDYIFDVRFLNNPMYVEELRERTGQDPAVRDYVLADSRAKTLQMHLYNLLDFALPLHRQEGRTYVGLGIGCTGGRHRSVALVGEIAQHLADQGYRVFVQHRDLAREEEIKSQG